MNTDFVFSWAENSQGRMVHVDEVPRGLDCQCKCPCCHETLLARHGDVRQHGFAHCSENRGANLDICYMVTMYKLAEQIIQKHKRIQAPSYYEIFNEINLSFDEVKVDSSYEREDKQPDVIAFTKEGEQYLIEFRFEYKVSHKKAIDYKNMNCMEIDLSNQTLESLEDFLLNSSEDRKWVNNESYFSRIEPEYAIRNKKVQLVDEFQCEKCDLRDMNYCAAVRRNGFFIIENNGQNYRICKADLFRQNLQKYQKAIEEKKQRQEQAKAEKERLLALQAEKENNRKIKIEEYRKNEAEKQRKADELAASQDRSLRTCLQCHYCLSWKSRSDYAYCGSSGSFKINQWNPLSFAQICPYFKRKI